MGPDVTQRGPEKVSSAVFAAWLREAVISRPRTSECWVDGPPRTSSPGGYATLRVDGRRRQASHYVLELDGHPKPFVGAEAAHSCDNPPCLNPKHLKWSTHKENQREMVERSGFMDRVSTRDYYGSANPKAKLTDADVIEIRRRRAAGEVQQRIADDYGITQVNVSEICLGKTWRHLL